MKNDALDALTLWEFPPEDFPRWRREFSDAVDSYEEYQRWLSGKERLAERMGTHAVRVQLTIEEMLAELAAHGGSKYVRESGGHHRPGRGEAADEWNL